MIKKKLGNGILYNESCIETLKRFEDEYIDLVVTSPPYDELRDYNNSSSWNWETFTEIADLLFPKMKKGGIVIWVVNDAYIDGSRSLTSFRQAMYFKEIGFNVHDVMIWNKQCFSFPHSNRYQQSYEYMFVFSKGIPKTFNPIADRKNVHVETRRKSSQRQKDGSLKDPKRVYTSRELGKRYNVWDCFPVNSSKERLNHPAQFPLELAKDHILSWSNPGDFVYEPFAGSGTTCYAAQFLKRIWAGSEIDPTYFGIAESRIRGLTRMKNLFKKD